MENAERKQSHLGVFMAVAHVSKFRNLGQPWRMKQTPRKTLSTNNDQAESPSGACGNSNVVSSVIVLEGH
jgi:hypothetical protein